MQNTDPYNPLDYYRLKFTKYHLRDMALDQDELVILTERGKIRRRTQKYYPEVSADQIEKQVNESDWTLPYPIDLLDQEDKEYIRKLEDHLADKYYEYIEKEDYNGWFSYLSNFSKKVSQESVDKANAKLKADPFRGQLEKAVKDVETENIADKLKQDIAREKVFSKPTKPKSFFGSLFKRRDGYEELQGGSRKQRKQNKRKSSKQNKRKSSKRRA